MPLFLRYFWRWITVAFGHSWSIYERLSGFAAVILFIAGRFQPVPESAGVMITEMALGIFVLLFIARMVLAPYWISQEQDAKWQARESSLKQQIADAQQRLDDRARRSETLTNIGLLLRDGNTVFDGFVASGACVESRKRVFQWFETTYAYLQENLGIAQAEAFRSASPVMGTPDNFPLKNGGTYQAMRGWLSFLGRLVSTLSVA
jgi:hypothetical protein